MALLEKDYLEGKLKGVNQHGQVRKRAKSQHAQGGALRGEAGEIGESGRSLCSTQRGWPFPMASVSQMSEDCIPQTHLGYFGLQM